MTVFQKIRIVTDSVCDIPQALLQELNIAVIPCYVNFDGKSLADDGVQLDRQAFYQRLNSFQPYPTTSAPSPTFAADLLNAAFVGYDYLIGIFVAAPLSSTFSNIRSGASGLPAERVTMIDSQSLTMGIGMQVMVAAEVAARTGDPAAVIDAVERVRTHQKLYALLFSLDALKRSGRVNPLIGSIGTLLQIKPILQVQQGKVDSLARIRTFGKGTDALYDLVVAQAPLDKLVILHIQNEAGANAFLARLGDLAPTDSHITEVGPTLGTHIGIGSLGAVTLNATWKV